MHEGKNGDLEGVAERRDLKPNGRGVLGDFLAVALASGDYFVVGMDEGHQCHRFAGQCGGSVPGKNSKLVLGRDNLSFSLMLIRTV